MPRTAKLLSTPVLLSVIYLLLWPPFILLATYTSHDAAVFGRWSTRLFATIAAYGVLLALATLILLRKLLSPGKEPSRPPRWLAWVRRKRLVLWAALMLPAAGWLVAVGLAVAVGPAAELAGRMTWALLDLAGAVLVFQTLVLLADRDHGERRTILIRIVAGSLGVITALMLVEVAGHVFNLEPRSIQPINPPNLRVRLDTIEYRTQVTTNAQGFREPKTIPPSHPSVVRVVVIGDSMSFGQGVNDDETFPRVAERLLHARFQFSNVELINVSRRGAGPAEYLEYLRRIVPSLEPDLIVVAYYTGNDCPVRQPYVPRSVEQLARLRHDVLRQGEPHLLMNSVLCRMAYQRVVLPLEHWRLRTSSTTVPGTPDPIFQTPNSLGELLAAARLTDEQQQRFDDLASAGWVEKGLDWKINPALIEAAILRPSGIADMMYLRDETREAMQHEWELCEAVLDKIVAEARQNSWPIHILIIPHAYQVDLRAVEQIREWHCEAPPTMLESRRQNDLIREFCERRDVPFIEPLDRFRAEIAAARSLFFPIDSHCTPDGHGLLAELLAEHLAKHIPRAGKSTQDIAVE